MQPDKFLTHGGKNFLLASSAQNVRCQLFVMFLLYCYHLFQLSFLNYEIPIFFIKQFELKSFRYVETVSSVNNKQWRKQEKSIQQT